MKMIKRFSMKKISKYTILLLVVFLFYLFPTKEKYDLDKDKKLENIPIWEFLEIITFGELVNFYDFYTNEYKLKDENKDVYILRDIVKLRNAVAHNNCILSELNMKKNKYPPSYKF